MIALLSNITVTSLAMRVNASTRQEVYTSLGFNTWLQEIIDPGSALYRQEPDAVFIVLHGSELFGAEGPSDRKSAEETLLPLVETIRQAFTSRPDIPFFVSTLDIPQRRIQPMLSPRPELFASSLWRDALESHSIPMIELAEIAANMGREAFYNKRTWYMGALPYSKSGEEAIAAEIGAIYRALNSQRKKCLALDLDNTLWGGEIGELETDGVHLDTTGSGSRFRDFQRRILELKENGVLLAVVTKNNLEDALSGINNHPAMLLREGDFAAIRANWEPKPRNIVSIADELNIGTEAFVFIDDNPIERETMRQELPEVLTPDFPEDSSELETFMRKLAREHFLQVRITSEDIVKTEQYKAEEQRRRHQSKFANIADYLDSLGMRMTIEGLNTFNIPRASQLTLKTNQFNLTASPYSESDMVSISQDPAYRAYVAGLVDNFGDYGKIALAIVRNNEGTALIDTFLMSCRVMGRDVERVFLHEVESDLLRRGFKSVGSRYTPNKRNRVAADFWKKVGYELSRKDINGVEFYTKALSASTLASSIEVVRLTEETEGA